jgi:hypothetical protein
MNLETALLNKLKSLQAQYAVDALRSPSDKSEFDFGYRVGYFAGMERAIECLLSVVEDEKYSDPDL